MPRARQTFDPALVTVKSCLVVDDEVSPGDFATVAVIIENENSIRASVDVEVRTGDGTVIGVQNNITAYSNIVTRPGSAEIEVIAPDAPGDYDIQSVIVEVRENPI